MRDPSVRYFKITDVASGDLVAWARWNVPEGKEAVFGAAAAADDDARDVSRLLVSREEKAVAGESKTTPTTTAADTTTTAAAVTDYPEGADPELCRGFFDG